VDERLVREFDGLDRERYDAVSARLGPDPESEESDWPVCLGSQAGTAKPAAEVFGTSETPGVQGPLVDERHERAGQQGRECHVGTRRMTQSDVPRRARRPRDRSRVKPHRSFDPQRAGQLESALWVAYYRREWIAFLRSAVLVTRNVFGLPWPATLRGSWSLMRATQLWAPNPDNDPRAARLAMERFYRLLRQHTDEPFDPAEAARLEVEWWHVHREHQHHNPDVDEQALVDALAALYACTFGVPDTAVRLAAEQRALAMCYCDQWVRAGCDLQSALIAHGRTALVRSYEGLLAAVTSAT